MEQCHVCFYLIGRRADVFASIKEVLPLEGFTHAFTQSIRPEAALAGEADVILADLRDGDAGEILEALKESRRPTGDIIALATGEQADMLVERFPRLTDIWTGPLGTAELKFHFRKWQQNYSLRRELAEEEDRMRQYRQKLEEKNRTLEMIFSTLDCGVVCHSVDGHELVSVNEEALRLLGYGSREEMAGDGFDLVSHNVLEEDKPLLRECIKSLRQPGDSVTAEYRVRHADGEILHILGRSKLVEENGQRYYQRSLLDFTQQKREADARLEKSDRKARYQKQLLEIFSEFLSENIDDIYMLTDGSMKHIEFVTSNIERVLGLSPGQTENLLGQLGKVQYLSGGRVSPADLERMEPGTHLDTRDTERIHQKTGEHLWFRESVYCVTLQGERKYIVCIADRTSERKAQEALREALEMAQVANRAKSAFLGSVSHDIRTPMNAILGMVTLLKEEADDPERVLEYTRKISSASQHLLGLINNVLDMNKLESGSAVLNIGELSLAELTDEISTIIRPQANEKKQTFEIFTNYLSHENLLGDKQRISQILLNILSNAVKYTPNGGRIEMWVAEQPQADPDYCRVRFTISDNGQGMSKEFLKVIFDPFTRELDTGINEVQGTGLGMAITRNLVDLMNGSIKVTSEPGWGSTFVVELELRIQKQEDEDPKFWENCGLKKMLVVDDDEDVCREIVTKMAENGVDTEYAVSGKRALELLQAAHDNKKPYDLLLLDWKMPGLSGVKTARLIQESYPGKMPIMLFTAYDWNDIEQEALEAGVSHFLSKPFFISNFRESVKRMVEEGKKPTEKEPPKPEGSVLEGKRVLVVDDIEINRMILNKILLSLGAVCAEAKNGKEAADMFRSSRPGEYDLIIMDIQMPLMNGYEATRAIRASRHPEAKSVAIIAMTANAFIGDIRGSLEAGMDAHIAKPIVLDQFKKTVAEVLERKQREE